MEITIKLRKVRQIFTYIVICLTMIHIVEQLYVHYSHHNYIFGLVPLFDFDCEANIPTFYTSLLLITCSALFAMIAYITKKIMNSYYYHWTGLAFIFLFLSMDESVSLHELLINPVRNAFHTSGILFYAWVIPYGLLLIILSFIYIKFFLHFSARERFLFFLAGVIYVSGAFGFELINGYYSEIHGENNIIYTVLVTIEELLEMIGLLVLMHAQTSYLSSERKEIRIKISAEKNG